MNKYLNEDELRRALSIIKEPGELFEIRIISTSRGTLKSGYFTDIDVAVKQLSKEDLTDCNVYIILNIINEACYSRRQRDKFLVVKNATGDNDMTAYDWIFIDIDPQRPKDTSSTDIQLEKAKDMCVRVYNYLCDQGFPRPVVGFSGNGYHLLYKVQMLNTKENSELIKKFLETLDELFTDNDTKVDKVNFNPSRPCKLYGSVAQKGLSTKERPHRMSYIVKIPEEIKPVEKGYLEKIVKVFDNEDANPNKYNNYNSRDFDLEEWLDKYGLRYRKASHDGSTKYVLDECPFNSDHGKDAAVFRRANGQIGFHCFHNGCYGKTWRDLRIKYEPDAYDKRQQYLEQKMTGRFNRDNKPKPNHIEKKDGEPIFYSAMDIFEMPDDDEQIIKSGLTEYDKRFKGFAKKETTIISGQTGSAKSTLLSQLVLNAVDAGNNVAVFSGELTPKRYMDWMNLQAANKSIVLSSSYANYYYLPREYRERIAKWLDDRFWLYNNKYGFNFDAILEQLEEIIERHKLDMLCIDNLMALNITMLDPDKYAAQSKFAWKLHELAQAKNVHIIFVCHPRKQFGLLGKYDISGTADLINAADNVLLVYRVNQDFRNAYKGYFQVEWDKGGTNVWHCDKARNGSTDDEYWPLYYEIETKRLKNEVGENKVYSWFSPEENREKISEAISKLEFEDVDNLDDIPFD